MLGIMLGIKLMTYEKIILCFLFKKNDVKLQGKVIIETVAMGFLKESYIATSKAQSQHVCI